MTLEDIGYEIYTEYGNPGRNVYIRNKAHGFIIPVEGDDRHVFGYYGAGCEMGTIQITNFKPDPSAQAETALKIIGKSLDLHIKKVDYFSIKKFLRLENHRQTKVFNSAVARVLEYLHLGYQDLWRLAESEAIKEHYKTDKNEND